MSKSNNSLDASNKLKLNPTKIEFFQMATNKRQHLLDNTPISISCSDIIPKTEVKLLGVNLDSAGENKLLTNAYVVSGLEYCNGINVSCNTLLQCSMLRNSNIIPLLYRPLICFPLRKK